MRSLRPRIKKINKTNSKSRSQNYSEETEIYISSELPVTAVLDEKPISLNALQRNSDEIGEKCGEVFKNKDAIFSYLCTLCGTLLDGIEEFKSHVKSHSNLCKLEESLDELLIKIDQNLNDENLDVDQFNNENILNKEIKEEKDEEDEKPGRMKSENSTKLKIQETIKKRKCKKSKQDVNYEISNSSETDEESDIPMRRRTKKRKQEQFDQNANNKTEVVDVVVKKELNTNTDADKNDKNLTGTTKKPKRKRIRKKKNERSNVFCKLCNKEFVCQLYLDSHLKYDHIARNPFVNLNTENQPDSWSDDDLDRQTKTEQTPNHCKKNEVIEELDKSISDDPFRCRYCDKRFKSRMNRYEHECLHTGEKPFKCETCGKTFRKKNVLDEHYITHTTEKPYKCEICNESYKHKKSLRTHILRHKGEKPYKCKYCDRAFTQAGNRNTHERTHTNEKPFQCSDCGTCFGSNRRLLIHSRRKHSLSKPHVCGYCGKAYAEIIDKKQHEKLHEKGGSFICKVCNAKFNTYKVLRNHIKSHSGLTEDDIDHNPTIISQTVSIVKTNASNDIVTSSSTSLPPPDITENQNSNIINENDKLLPSWNSTVSNPIGIFGLSFPQYSQN